LKENDNKKEERTVLISSSEYHMFRERGDPH